MPTSESRELLSLGLSELSRFRRQFTPSGATVVLPGLHAPPAALFLPR
jgi:hypothetical protein